MTLEELKHRLAEEHRIETEIGRPVHRGRLEIIACLGAAIDERDELQKALELTRVAVRALQEKADAACDENRALTAERDKLYAEVERLRANAEHHVRVVQKILSR